MDGYLEILGKQAEHAWSPSVSGNREFAFKKFKFGYVVVSEIYFSCALFWLYIACGQF